MANSTKSHFFDIDTAMSSEALLSKGDSFSKKPISTISYNTDEFLKVRLSHLVAKGYISHYYWITHKGELIDGDIREKDHKHLILFPLKSLSLNVMRNYLSEPVKDNSVPLGVMPFRITTEHAVGDWIEYAIHDPQYLARKGETREFSYEHKQIVTNDIEALGRDIKSIKCRVSDIEILMSYAEQHKTWLQVAKLMFIPRNQLSTFKRTYKELCEEVEVCSQMMQDVADGNIQGPDPYYVKLLDSNFDAVSSARYYHDMVEFWYDKCQSLQNKLDCMEKMKHND